MKNRLSTLLMVLLTFCMVTCKSCKDDAVDPSVEGTWKVVSVTSSLGASAVQPKYSQAVGGQFVITSSTYTLTTPAGATTTGGTGSAVISKVSAADGNVLLDGKVTLTYSGLTAAALVFSGDVTANSVPIKSTQNVHIITLAKQ